MLSSAVRNLAALKVTDTGPSSFVMSMRRRSTQMLQHCAAGSWAVSSRQRRRSYEANGRGVKGHRAYGTRMLPKGALMFLWLSPKLCETEALKAPLDCLRALCQHQTGLAIRLVDDLDKLKRAYQSHKSENGTRSRPWTRYAALGNDEAECQELGSTDCPRLVRTFLSWLAERSAVAKKTPLVFW